MAFWQVILVQIIYWNQKLFDQIMLYIGSIILYLVIFGIVYLPHLITSLIRLLEETERWEMKAYRYESQTRRLFMTWPRFQRRHDCSLNLLFWFFTSLPKTSLWRKTNRLLLEIHHPLFSLLWSFLLWIGTSVSKNL